MNLLSKVLDHFYSSEKSSYLFLIKDSGKTISSECAPNLTSLGGLLRSCSSSDPAA